METSYFLLILEHLGIGPVFQQAVQTIYRQPSSAVHLNGHTSSPFPISRRTRQGCLLSPLLFALVLEPVAEALLGDLRFSGLEVQNRHYKLSLFTDEMILYVTKPTTSLPAIKQILDSFYLVSGLKVNKGKSLLFLLHISTMNSPYSWAMDYWSYLSVKIPTHFSKLISVNLKGLNESVKTMLKSWNNTSLSWFERIQLIKMMISPNFFFCSGLSRYTSPELC